MGRKGGTGQIFLVHGEEDSMRSLQQIVGDVSDHPPVIPKFGESFEI
ncbi:MAG: hypothetical protein R3C20_08440 [Planctomycetaceae bacterium]